MPSTNHSINPFSYVSVRRCAVSSN